MLQTHNEVPAPQQEPTPLTRRIEEIIVGERHRRELGDIAGLAASIADLGLLHPVVVRPDGSLIAGERRLRAAKLLGWIDIPVTIVDLDDIARGEYAENVHRKDFTLSEAVAVKRALEPIEREAAKERQREGGRSGGKASGKLPEASKGNAADKAAKATGMARRTLEKAEAIVDAAEAEPEKYGKLLDDMDRTGRVNGVFKRLKVIRQAEPPVMQENPDEPPANLIHAPLLDSGVPRGDIGADGGSEIECLCARVEELEHEKRRLEIEAVGLKDEIEDLKVARPLTEHSVEALLKLLELKIENTAKTRAALKEIRKAERRPPQLELKANDATTAAKATPPVVTSDGKAIRDEIFSNYRKLPLEDLEVLIDAIRSAAGRGVSVRPKQWTAVDRMRAHAGELKRALVASVQAHGSTTGATRH